MKTKSLLLGLLLSIASHAQQGAVPRVTYFNGVLKNAAGNPQTGLTPIAFSLYENQEGGTALWSETQNLTLDDQGRYTALLGATQPDGLPLDVFASGKARWLGVAPQIEGAAEQPRVLLVGVPYALKAADADTLGGLPASAFLMAAGAVAVQPTAGGDLAPRTETASDAPAAACAAITSNGAAAANEIALFSAPCKIEPSVLYQSSGQIGIGTKTPTATLDVNGATALGGEMTLNSNGTATATAGANSFPIGFSASSYDSSTSTPISQLFQWQALATANDTASPSASMALLYASGTATPAVTGFSIGSNGVVTFAPQQIFPGTGAGTITGVTAGSGLSGGGTSGAITLTNTGLLGMSAGAGLLSSGGSSPTISLNTTYTNTLYLPLTGGELTGSLGIGEATPYTQLHIRRDVSGQLGPSLLLMNGAGSVGAGGSVDFDGYDPGSSSQPAARIQSLDDGSYSANLTFQTKNPGSDSNSLQEHMRISSAGQVGIATTSPNSQLGVVAQSPVPAITAQGWTAPVGSLSDASPAIQANGGNSSTGKIAAAAGIVAHGGSGGASDGPGGAFTGGSSSGGRGDGIDAYAGSGNAGTFDGNVEVEGVLTANVKEFKIDHPLDPANKYLVHASIESSEMMNVYSGNVTTSAGGSATVQLPDWFETLNTDFRYQLTVIGQFAQAIVASKIQGNQFQIKTSAPDVEVSWLVSAVRQDPYAKAHPLVTVPDKNERERGYYLNPELYGAPTEKQMEWARHPEIMKQVQAQRQKQVHLHVPAAGESAAK
jgi:hypothetical protein